MRIGLHFILMFISMVLFLFQGYVCLQCNGCDMSSLLNNMFIFSAVLFILNIILTTITVNRGDSYAPLYVKKHINDDWQTKNWNKRIDDLDKM